MKELSEEEVGHIAHLARIGLSEKDSGRYQKDLSAILTYFEKLQEVNTESVSLIGYSTGIENVSRKDQAQDFNNEGKDFIMKNVPQKKDGQIKVKSIL